MTARKLAAPDTSWHWLAACNDDHRPPDVKPEWFGPLDYRPRGRHVDEPSVRRALAVCAHCPVIMQCRRQADGDRHARGVWAGRYRRDGGPDAA